MCISRVKAGGLERNGRAGGLLRRLGADEPVVCPGDVHVHAHRTLGDQVAFKVDVALVRRVVPAVQPAQIVHAEHAHTLARPAAAVTGKHLDALDLLDRLRCSKQILIRRIRLEELLADFEISARIAVGTADHPVAFRLRVVRRGRHLVGLRPRVLRREQELADRPVPAALRGVGDDEEINLILIPARRPHTGGDLKQVRWLRGLCRVSRTRHKPRAQQQHGYERQQSAASPGGGADPFRLSPECPHRHHSSNSVFSC